MSDPKLSVRDLLAAPDVLTLDLEPGCVGLGASMVSEPRPVEVRLSHPGDVVRQRDELQVEARELRRSLEIRDQRESEHCGVLWCRGCAKLFDDLKAEIRAASPWTGTALCWCRSDAAPDCATPSCVRLRELLG